MCLGVTPVVSQMLSAHLQQMAADSNGPALCARDLSASRRRLSAASSPYRRHPVDRSVVGVVVVSVETTTNKMFPTEYIYFRSSSCSCTLRVAGFYSTENPLNR